MTHIILNHALVQAEKALISVHDRGFRYGDGLFETIRVAGGVPYRFDWHMERLSQGLMAVRIPFDTALLKADCQKLLAINGMQDGLLRIQITRGEGGRGYLPPQDMKPTLVIETLPLPEVPQKPVDLWGSSYRRASLEALPVHYKLCQGMNSTLARIEAADHHCFDALMIGENGHIAETSSANIFWFKEGRLYTPSPLTGALKGGMRAAVMELSPWPLQEAEANLETLRQAEAMFITNVALKALPVGYLKPANMLWKSSEAARAINALIDADIENYSQSHRNAWLKAAA